jgi:hypothetical protein
MTRRCLHLRVFLFPVVKIILRSAKNIIFIMIIMACLGLGGCSDLDDAVFPEMGIYSLDSLMFHFKSALIADDLEALESLFDHDTGFFSFSFRAQEVEELSIPVNTLNMEEMLQVWRNIFSGQEFVNHAGETVPAVTHFEVNQLDRTTDWRRPDNSDMTWFDALYGVKHAYFRARFTLHRAGDFPPLITDALLDFRVRPPCGDGSYCSDLESYALFGINSDLWVQGEGENLPFGALVYMFFTHEVPNTDLTP